jgi:DNA integrity scanning protein DisA with diadenylate cyclase activity
VVIVSEQTGELSFAKDGVLKTKLSPEKLTRLLDEIFH